MLVNGETREAACRDDDTLLHVLRNHLGLLGTRFGCGHEACGACTVLIDGAPAWSCTMRAGDVGSKMVTTVEGLPELAALREAFLAEQAGQCGYCLSGILVRAAALIRTGQALDRASVATALDGNLCRCGAHNRILAAVLRAAAALRPQPA
jgi:nicotinate dehydrogenase subunit A